MRLLVSALFCGFALAAQTFEAPQAETGWRRLLKAYGLAAATQNLPEVLVLDGQTKLDGRLFEARVEDGLVLILRGHSGVAKQFGVEAGSGAVVVQQIRDVTRPELPLIWEKEEKLLETKLNASWTVYASERWTQAPVLAGRKLGKGAVLWTATSIGLSGYEKFPYLPQALARLGVKPKYEARNLTVFFDASHRLRVDVPYLVGKWRQAGLSAIHVTSWQFDGASAEKADWLAKLIAECHRNGIAVYAWLELPHVSERFWEMHPECREKTAAGTDAQLDWRKLVNLVNPACAAKAEANVLSLLRSYDWDGANLGELYFESLEGLENPARFTPFSSDAVSLFREQVGVEPVTLFAKGVDEALVEKFVEARAALAAKLQQEWLAKLAVLRDERPNFDVMLTHIDDRLDTNMRKALGADSARLLAATEAEDVPFLIEDPATVWHLGPERYREIRKHYNGLTKNPGRLAIDLNIVERYQDVYPTKQQTGGELVELIHEAAQNFDQVALYFEASLLPEDLPFVASAAAKPEARATWVRSEGALSVDGVAWPLRGGGAYLLPPGKHEVKAAAAASAWEVEPRNLELLAYAPNGEMTYSSRTQAWLFSKKAFAVDGMAAKQVGENEFVFTLPRAKARTVRLEGQAAVLLNQTADNP